MLCGDDGLRGDVTAAQIFLQECAQKFSVLSGFKRKRHKERGDLLCVLCALRGEWIFGQRLNTEDTEGTENVLIARSGWA